MIHRKIKRGCFPALQAGVCMNFLFVLAFKHIFVTRMSQSRRPLMVRSTLHWRNCYCSFPGPQLDLGKRSPEKKKRETSGWKGKKEKMDKKKEGERISKSRGDKCHWRQKSEFNRFEEHYVSLLRPASIMLTVDRSRDSHKTCYRHQSHGWCCF